jgi:hypothetical protein
MVSPATRADYAVLTPYKCYICEGLLGMTASNRLYIGAAIFERPITITCGYCEKRTYWKPSNDDKKENKIR